MRNIILLTAAFLAACEAEAPPAAVATGPLPAELCTKMREAIAKLVEQAVLDFDAQDQPIIPETTWIMMSPDARNQLSQALAFRAACATSAPPPEQTVTIKSETGRILTERVMPTSVDPTALLQE